MFSHPGAWSAAGWEPLVSRLCREEAALPSCVSSHLGHLIPAPRCMQVPPRLPPGAHIRPAAWGSIPD